MTKTQEMADIPTIWTVQKEENLDTAMMTHVVVLAVKSNPRRCAK